MSGHTWNKKIFLKKVFLYQDDQSAQKRLENKII